MNMEYGSGYNPEAEAESTPDKPKQWWQELYERYGDSLKKGITKTVTAGLLLQFTYFEAQKAYGQTLRNEPSVASRTEKSPEKKENYPKKTETEVRKDLLTDKYERLFVESEGQLHEFSDIGSERSISYDFADIDKFLTDHPGEEKEISVVHTHPTAVYKHVFDLLKIPEEKQAAMLKTGNVSEHPPSMMDFFDQYQLQDYFKNRNIKISSKAIDPRGTWKYTVSAQNKLIDSIIKSQNESAELLDQKLSPADWEIVSSTLRDKSTDPRMLVVALEKDTGDKQKNDNRQRIGKIITQTNLDIQAKYTDAWKTYETVEQLGVKIIGAETPKERQAAIAEYIEYCKKQGIFVEIQK